MGCGRLRTGLGPGTAFLSTTVASSCDQRCAVRARARRRRLIACSNMLLQALGAWDRALRRDECGAWHIDGTRGAFTPRATAGRGFSSPPAVLPATGWRTRRVSRSARSPTTATTRAPSGCMSRRRPARPVIREALGIRKRQEISGSTRERLRAFAFGRSTRGEATLGAETGSTV